MGDIADDLIDQWIGEPGAFGYGRQRHPPPPPKCKQCGETDLWWNHTGERWQLMEDMKPHACKLTPESCGFEDETGT